jgi:nicotinamide-nucleotide amidase
MHVEIMAIGDELISGHRVDTNSAWISQQLRSLGISTARHITVPDQPQGLRAAILDSATRSHIVISTGGLGPTADDITREILADVAGLTLETDPRMLEHIRQLFQSRGREMPQSNQVQARRPATSDWIENPHGTAPGVAMTFQLGEYPCRWFALPGVPAEMHEMWSASLIPAIQAINPHRTSIVVRQLRCFGVGESNLESQLPRELLRGGNPEIGITVSRGTITLRITATGPTTSDAASLIEPVVCEIEESLGDLIFGSENEELHDVLLRDFAQRGKTLTTVEGPSDGLLAHWLTKADSAHTVFLGGLVDSSLTTQTNGDASESLEKRLIAQQAATGATSAVGLATLDGSPDQAILIAIDEGQVFQKQMLLKFHPDITAVIAAKRALNLLRLNSSRS